MTLLSQPVEWWDKQTCATYLIPLTCTIFMLLLQSPSEYKNEYDSRLNDISRYQNLTKHNAAGMAFDAIWTIALGLHNVRQQSHCQVERILLGLLQVNHSLFHYFRSTLFIRGRLPPIFLVPARHYPDIFWCKHIPVICLCTKHQLLYMLDCNLSHLAK